MSTPQPQLFQSNQQTTSLSLPYSEIIRLSLIQRDTREKSQLDLIEYSKKLSNQLIILKSRNNSLLRASNNLNSTNTNAGGSNSLVVGSNTSNTDTNPVKQAYLNSIENQLNTTRIELSEQYKIQSNNSQRLLSLTDTLREVEDRGREEREELRKLRSEVEGLRERSRWVKEVVSEKERQLLILQDEFNSLELELSQILIQNDNLKIDNSSLLQRWIESKNAEADKLNELNIKEEEEFLNKSSNKLILTNLEKDEII